MLFLTQQRGVRTNFLCFEGGVLSKFLQDNSSFSATPPDNYCTVPYISPSICTNRLIFGKGAFIIMFFLNMTSNLYATMPKDF